MLGKDRLRFFSHDSDMRNDLKIRGLRSIYGLEGYAVWCCMLEVLTDSPTLSINYKKMELLLAGDFGLSPERLEGIMKFCEGIGLFQRSGEEIYSRALKNRFKATIGKAEQISKVRSQAARKRWECENDAKVMQMQCTIAMQIMQIREEKIREEKIRQEKIRQERKRQPSCRVTASLNFGMRHANLCRRCCGYPMHGVPKSNHDCANGARITNNASPRRANCSPG